MRTRERLLLLMSVAVFSLMQPVGLHRFPLNSDFAHWKQEAQARDCAEFEQVDESGQIQVAVLIGSLREKSYSRYLAQSLQRLAPENMVLTIVEIDDLPFYNPDIDGDDAPQSWHRVREELARSDALLFITPEYNRSVPAVLKNAIDVGSRPHLRGPMARKPAAVISLTTGSLGGFGANHHLRQVLVVLNVPVMQQPEAYIGGVASLFDEDGNLVNSDFRRFLHEFLFAFEEWSSIHSMRR